MNMPVFTEPEKEVNSFVSLQKEAALKRAEEVQKMIQEIHAGIQACHENIRRTAALQHIQIFLNSSSIGKLSVDMQDCSLCKRRQCLVQTIDHHICSQLGSGTALLDWDADRNCVSKEGCT